MIYVNAEVDPEEFIVLPEWQNKVIRINLARSPENMMDIVVTVTEQEQDQDDKNITGHEGDQGQDAGQAIQIQLLQENSEHENESSQQRTDDQEGEDEPDELATATTTFARPICRRRRSRSRSDPCINPEELNSSHSSLTQICPELLKPCEYYRRKYFHHFNDDCPHCWMGLSTLQKSAGQKVIDKISAENKILEAELGRKCSIKSTNMNNTNAVQLQSPPKRKPIKLEPLPVRAN